MRGEASPAPSPLLAKRYCYMGEKPKVVPRKAASVLQWRSLGEIT
jgi:hypothetical protein